MLKYICFIFFYFVSLHITFSQNIKVIKIYYNISEKDSCQKLLREYLSLSKVDAKYKIEFIGEKKHTFYFKVETDRLDLYDLFFINLNKKRRVNYIRFLTVKQIFQIFYQIE